MFDAKKFCEDYNISYETQGKHTTKGWVNIDCPFCQELGKFHGGVNLKEGYYNCWKCGFTPMWKVIGEILSVNSAKAKEIYKNYIVSNILRMDLRDEKQCFSKFVTLPGGELKKMHIKYLEKRRFDAEQIEGKYKIRGGSIAGKYAYRIIIPVIYQNRVISYQARDITGESDLRYLACELDKCIMNYKNILYNLDNCNTKKIGIVEGVTDVWRMGDGFAGTFGLSMKQKQIIKLLKYDEIFILFDDEKDAIQRARMIGKQLASFGKKVEVIHTGDFANGDPATFTTKQVLKIKEELGFWDL